MIIQAAPFADGSTDRLRASDTVTLDQSGDFHIVLCDTGSMAAIAGRPGGMVERGFCTPWHRSVDSAHIRVLDEVKNSDHPLREIILQNN
ncbi:MAG TPA: hypothetical protein DCX34_03460 [Roseovarius sp.]|nr:hypothetical protein [Roseovarius sp.]|tara:strand:- start:264 stop:533 length:270 start_codon:yes stop_codon:yes gene_type:complete